MGNKVKGGKTTCLNCGNTFKGAFCPKCGQKGKVKRLKITEMTMDFANSFIGGDNKFANTCRDLCRRPGIMVRDYLLGKRIGYYNPLQLYVFLLTIFAVTAYLIGESSAVIDHIITKELFELEDVGEYTSITVVMGYLNRILANKLFGAIVFAVLAVLPYRLLFRGCKIPRPDGSSLPLNLTEQFYTQMFRSCIGMIVSIALLPVCLIDGTDKAVGVVYQIVVICYYIVIYKQLLGIGWIKSALLNLFAFFLTVLTGFTLLLLILIVVALRDELM